jgi:integrase
MDDAAIGEMISKLTALLSANKCEEPATGPTFGELAGKYLERAHVLGQDSASLRSRLATLGAFFGVWPLDLIDSVAWAGFKAARRAWCSEHGGYTVSTANVELAMCKTICAMAVEAGSITRNPFAGVKPERGANRRRETLTEAELGRILEAIDVPWFRAYILLLADTGMRRTEGLKVRWTDVERGYAVVQREDSKGKVARTIKLTPRARDALLALGRPAGAEFVFASRCRGCEVLSTPRLAVMFRDAVKRAGVVFANGKLPTSTTSGTPSPREPAAAARP